MNRNHSHTQMTKNRIAALAAGLALAALTAAPAGAAPQEDVLVMKDGRVFTDLDAEQKDGYVSITLEAGEIKVADGLIDILLEEGKEISFVPQTEEERKYYEEEGMVRYNDQWMRAGTAERIISKKLKERLKNAKEDLEHKLWRSAYEEETKTFAWKFTTAKTVGERYMAATDAYYDIFKKDWRVKRDRGKAKLSINMYDNMAQFQQVADAQPGVLGYFRFVGDYDLNVFYDRNDPDFSMYVLFHEVGHYLHKLLNEDFKMPHWPGESVCEYYGAAELSEDGKKLTVGLIPNARLASIRSDMENGKKIVLKEMILTDGFEDYTWGWSFVHMLMQDKKRADDFKDFFAGLAEGNDIRHHPWNLGLKTVKPEEKLAYFMECMDLEDESELEALQEEWYTYIVEELEFEGAGAAFWEAKSARQLGEIEDARKMYKKAFEEDEANARANDHYAYYELLPRNSDEALEHIEKAVEKAPLSAEYRWSYGQCLELRAGMRGGKEKDAEEGERQKRLALELDPDIQDRVFDFDF